MIIKALYGEEFVLHVGLMLKKFKNHEDYIRTVEKCYFEMLPEDRVKVIFNCFDRLIRKHLKTPFSKEPNCPKDMILSSRKRFAHLMLSILQKIGCLFEIDFCFAHNLPVNSYFMIMTSFIEGIISNSLLGAKNVNEKLQKLYPKFSKKELSKIEDREKVLTLVLLFHYYSFCIIEFEYPEIDVERLDPSFLARLTLVQKNLRGFFECFDADKLLQKGANSLYNNHLNPGGEVDYIEDFTKRSHNLPPIPEDRKDLQWILQAYNKLWFYLIKNREIEFREYNSKGEPTFFGFLLSEVAEEIWIDSPKKPNIGILAKIAEAIKIDPIKPHSYEIVNEIDQLCKFHLPLFMETLNSLYSEELVLHVCLMINKIARHKLYVAELEVCYVEGSHEIIPWKKIDVIFNCFDELIRNQMKEEFLSPEERDIDLKYRKYLAHLMLSILSKVSFSPTKQVKLSFASREISTRSYYMIMTGYIEGLTTNSFLGAKTANCKLHELNKKFHGVIPTTARKFEKILSLLLLFQHYSYFIFKYDFAEVDIDQAEPILLARIASASNESSMSYLFDSFNSVHLVLNQTNYIYNRCLSPSKVSLFIMDFRKNSHHIPRIPNKRKDLQWILGVYNKLRLYLIDNNPFK
jgi:hypothetical protein